MRWREGRRSENVEDRRGQRGPMGGGHQWMSWSSIDDAVGMLHFAIASEAAGAFNAVSPAPVTNAQFARLLGREPGWVDAHRLEAGRTAALAVVVGVP